MLRKKSALDKVVRQRFVATLSNGQTVAGVLVEFDESTFVFADVKLMEPNGNASPAPGQLYVDRGQVAYMQKLAADAAL
ncbi:hypothetical protein G4X40_19780 [Rhodococcus sp. D2-41]|uniref:Uncharacterized protein n=1 Tax=Speluncibacter jeojiensis TaxID=2710754 RepID=A0A9X4LXS0_9ACTN|nr:hypothetical protein [Rhodococcus sp. D2-41]MDG3012384.1 hypothetical protein [Rhodococcus sp. D2-41]MDG3013556.1 hypothetical protein [Corynebacteriales bacterium D3-21]